MPLKQEFLASPDTSATTLVDAYAAQFPTADGSPLDQRRMRLRTILCMQTARALGAWDYEQVKAIMLALSFSEDEIADFMNAVGTDGNPFRTLAEIEAGTKSQEKKAAEFQAGGEKKKQRRGGRRVNSMLMLDAVRDDLTDGYIAKYHHPASFYNTHPAKFTSLAEEQLFLGALFGEIEKVNGDAYAPERIRKMVTNDAKIRAMNVGDPRPYAGVPKTWDVRGAENLTLCLAPRCRPRWVCDPCVP